MLRAALHGQEPGDPSSAPHCMSLLGMSNNTGVPFASPAVAPCYQKAPELLLSGVSLAGHEGGKRHGAEKRNRGLQSPRPVESYAPRAPLSLL